MSYTTMTAAPADADPRRPATNDEEREAYTAMSADEVRQYGQEWDNDALSQLRAANPEETTGQDWIIGWGQPRS